MNLRFGGVNYCDIPILIGVNDACQYNRLCSDSCRTVIFLGNVCLLFVDYSCFLSLALSVLLMIEEHMLIQHHLEIFICNITPVYGNKTVPKVQLLHLSLGC